MVIINLVLIILITNQEMEELLSRNLIVLILQTYWLDVVIMLNIIFNLAECNFQPNGSDLY